jgi:hypothetical protein
VVGDVAEVLGNASLERSVRLANVLHSAVVAANDVDRIYIGAYQALKNAVRIVGNFICKSYCGETVLANGASAWEEAWSPR